MASRRHEEPADEGNPARTLDVVQRWFQEVLTHPGGVEAGADSPAARELIPEASGNLEGVVERSARLEARERLAVYANAYYARLLECLAESFPALERTLGRDAFADLAFAYLQDHPSRSYTLSRLGDGFPDWLEATRPDRARPGETASRPFPGTEGWAGMLVDLARLELTVEKVFDGPGIEGQPVLDADQLRRVPPDLWPRARLRPVPCLRVLRFDWPVNGWYTRMRRRKREDEGELPPLPEAREQWVAITRRDFVVRRIEIEPPHGALLEAFLEGASVGDALRRAAERSTLPDEELALELRRWFREDCATRLFEAVELDG